MSAINVFVSKSQDAGFIVADSLAYTPKRRIFGFSSKVRTFPHAGTAVGGRGNAICLSKLMMILDRCSDFDEMCIAIEKRCPREWRMRFTKMLNEWSGLSTGDLRHQFNKTELVLVGFSAKHGRIMAMAGSSTTKVPFELIELKEGHVFRAPALPHDVASQLKQPSEDSVGAIPEILVEWMLKQREISHATTDGELIGGHAVLTHVTKKFITQRVMYRWDDKVGQKIEPVKSALEPSAQAA